jgi:hypothetical protein
VSTPPETRRLATLPPILHQGASNDCGPFALAMAATALLGTAVPPAETARRLRFLRVPFLGATLPWGILFAARGLGLAAHGHWLGRIADLTRLVDLGLVPLVLVHPDDWPSLPWYALHYRVVVGYRDDPSLPGGGELCFACSGSPASALPDGLPGNVAISYAQFQRQWHTYITPRWYADFGRRD